MSILSELNSLLESIKLPVETGIFSGVPPDEYAVLTPLTDSFEIYGDNVPLIDVSEVRISFFSKNSYTKRKNQLVGLLLQAGFTITGRKYVSFEADSGYYNYAIDVAKEYEME